MLTVLHCHTAYRMTQLRLLPWFSYEKPQLDWFCVAAAKDLMQGETEFPPGWRKPSRQQVNPMAKDRRCSIIWDVPQSQLEAAFSSSKYTSLRSPPVYAAGSGWRLVLTIDKIDDGKPRHLGTYFSASSYECQGEEVVPEPELAQVKYCITHQPPGSASRRTLTEGSATLSSGWGNPEAFKANSMAELQRHLSDGYLKLGATFHVIH
jgi:hypothetical protein